MAHFIGYVRGGRGEASRLGHKATGLETLAASWQGAVRISLYCLNGVDHARIEFCKHNGAGINGVIYDGPVNADPMIFDELERA